ncbi:alkaline phosphatase family protein [Psychroserpens damuponensis]|uniref:alkaline phosphatase family protein n=1 Tax=Psychroserpens damuponensis TaxID=943936 RepID=UPI0006945881|nr:alkaline phosphatase family protein [Psychroserpens damuponensis]
MSNKKNKTLLIGWDAADWEIIWPLISKGEMPALKKLISRGVYGNMSTMNPPYSPMLWSSVATGKTPDKHGVLGFIELMPDMKGVRPVTANSRKVKAIWNILHNQGFKSNLIGWWPSFPAEPINGVVVTDKFQKVKADPDKKNPMLKGTIHPESLTQELEDLRMFPYEITKAHILPCIPKAAEIDQENDKGLRTFARILAENTSVHAAATNLIRTTKWDFTAVYYDLIDHFCHAFMKFHPPKLNAVPQHLFEIYNQAVVSAYKIQDMMLERTMSLIDDDTTVIVMSDHGYESGYKRILKMPKYPAAPALEHRQFGIFVAAGPNIKQNEKVFGLSLIDVAPTLLHMFDLPIGKDMDGKVALDIFKEPTKPKYIDSWETLEGDFGQHKEVVETDQLNEQEALQQLIDLGYIDKPDEDIGIAILKTKCDLKHNLGRVYLGKKDFEKAKKILLELINDTYPKYQKSDFEGEKKEELEKQGYKEGDSVVDIIPYYMDLLSISIAQNEIENAEHYLSQLRRLDKRFDINTYFSEAKILVAKGKIHQALKVLQAAKNNKPNAEVWYQIGKIHMQLFQFEKAKEAFENALNFEVDRAKFHQALAATLIHLKDYENAAEHALISIELVKYYPEAHYTLGEALEKLGDLENAKIAYETANSLKPVKHVKAEKAIENIDDKLVNKTNLKDKAVYKYRKDQIVIVSGLPRSGTSVMMQMLNKGGVEVLTDANRKADASNPKGYFEYDPVMSIHKDNKWLDLAQNKSVKVVAPLLKFLDPKYRYKVIFMSRDLNEIVKSQQKMIGKDPETLPTRLFETYKKHLHQVDVWKDKEPSVELIYVDYKDVINDSKTVVDKVTSFVGVDMNKDEMLKCVDKSLYRNKL